MLAIEILLKGTALLLVVFGIATALRSASAATRHLVWTLGLVGLLSLPLLTAATPWRVDILPAPIRFETSPTLERLARDDLPIPTPVKGGGLAAQVGSPGEHASGPPDAADGAATAGSFQERPSTDGASEEAPLRSAAVLLLAIWGAGAMLVAARWVAGAIALRRCLASSRELEGPEWDEPLRGASERLFLDARVRLLVSDRVPMPLTAGVLRPVVLLPESAFDWSAERRQAVLVHELAHVSRKDGLAHTLGWVACALWWFHPLAWVAARHLRAESERACDDLVLRAGTRASSYADHLLDIVCHAASPRAPAPAMPLAQPSEFEGRILRILSTDARRHGLSTLKAFGLAVGLAAVAVPLAAIGTAPTEGEIASAEVEEDRSAPRRVVDALLPDGVERFVSEKFLERKPEGEGAKAEGHDFEIDGGFGGQDSDSSSDSDSDSSSDTDSNSDADDDADEAKQAVSPQEATRIVGALAASLRDRDAEVRRAAAQALGEVADPRAVEALMRALRSDSDAGVRAMAAWALGEIEDPRAVPALGEALRGDQSAEVRSMTAWALGEIESPQAIEYLSGALRDASTEVRVKATWALGEIEDPRAVPALAAALRDDNVEIRRNAAWALGEIESPQAVEAVTGALRDADVEVRRKAAWALGEIEDPRAVPALTAALRDADAETRSFAVWAIGEIQPASAPPPLFDLAGDASAEVRKHVAWALGEIEDPAGVPALRRLIQDSNAEVRKNAIWALTQIHAPSAYEALVALLNDEDPEVRKAAAHALGDADWDE